MMKKTILIIAALLLLSQSGFTTDKYYLGPNFGFANLSGGDDSLKYPLQFAYGAHFGFNLNNRWYLELSGGRQAIYNDSTKSSAFAIGGKEENSTLKYESVRLGFILGRYLFHPDNRLNFRLGIGGGMMIWKYLESTGDTVINVLGAHDETVDFKASELFFGFGSALDLNLSQRWRSSLNFQADYMTGAGAEFADEINSERNRWQYNITFSLSFFFGDKQPTDTWPSEKSWSSTKTPVKQKTVSNSNDDSDLDGVPDSKDECSDTPFGALTDRDGCPVDSDGDGVYDGLDDCPATDREAIGQVDIHGCPIDTDFDGLPDYLDQCPNNPIGAQVDANGCPLDADADGVPDGLDNCPNTLYGVPVDKFGCIDLGMLSEPMVLNINYPAGSFEIDPFTKDKLKQLARVLNFVKDIKLEINGYTDNIGTTVNNQKLSEKRANRVRDFLMTQGIATERMKVFGRGETKFIATNDNAEGRAKNRRIEIIFYQ